MAASFTVVAEDLAPAASDRLNRLLVIGKSSSGETILLKHIVLQDIFGDLGTGVRR